MKRATALQNRAEKVFIAALFNNRTVATYIYYPLANGRPCVRFHIGNRTTQSAACMFQLASHMKFCVTLQCIAFYCFNVIGSMYPWEIKSKTRTCNLPMSCDTHHNWNGLSHFSPKIGNICPHPFPSTRNKPYHTISKKLFLHSFTHLLFLWSTLVIVGYTWSVHSHLWLPWKPQSNRIV